MAEAHDLVIRGGTVADGTGNALREADVAVTDGVVVAVGEVAGTGREEYDARGLLVTPGFVDIHTHYDGQATWDARLAPSSWHGVTTAVMGNGGVGFAPCRPDDHGVRVKLSGGREVTGTLKGYDQLLNLVLDEAIEHLRDAEDALKISDETRALGLLVCRGTSVMVVSALDSMEEIANPFLAEDGGAI